MKNNLDWTHKEIKLNDIRKLKELYVIDIDELKTISLFIKDNIFEERLKSYFLKDIKDITREDILSVKWNMFISKGYYVKISDIGEISYHDHDPEKWYISYLDISGPLSTFISVYKNKELNK